MTLLDLPNLAIDKRAFEADLCRRSFYDFFLRFWPVAVPEKLNRNWHIKFICDEMQRAAARVFAREPKEYDLAINVPPGSTKSTICSVMFPAWCWANDPSMRLLCSSHKHDLSLYLAGQCRRVITGEKYQALFPEVVLAKSGTEEIETSRWGWRLATSVGSSPLGKHAHFHICDDLIAPDDALSDAVLLTLHNYLDHTLPDRMIDLSTTLQVFIGQRLTQLDTFGYQFAKENRVVPFRRICLPAELEDGRNVMPRSCRGFYRDGLLDPHRLPKAILEGKLNEKGDFAYSGQYRQDPKPLGGGLFKIDRIEVIAAAPKLVVEFRYWDKASSSDKPGKPGRGSHTVGVRMGRDVQGRFWITDVKRGRWEPDVREAMIKQTAVTDGRKIIVAMEEEGGSGGKESAINTVKNLAGFSVRRDKPSGDKTLRADPFATQVNVGNVKLLNGPWVAAYLRELEFFPFSATKDQVDASSGCFKMVTSGRHVGAL